jgi:hypothetical protein
MVLGSLILGVMCGASLSRAAKLPPRISGPSLSVPSVTVPTVKAPTLTVPTIKAPHVTVPTVKAPHVSVPTVKAPHVTVPTVKAPHVSVPTIKAPHVTVPIVKAPHVTVPIVKARHVSVPIVKAPTRTVPIVKAPPVSVPTVKPPLGGPLSVAMPPISTPTVKGPPSIQTQHGGSSRSGSSAHSATRTAAAGSSGSSAPASTSGKTARRPAASQRGKTRAGRHPSARKLAAENRRLRALVSRDRGCLASLTPPQDKLLSLRAGVGRRSPSSASAVARTIGVSLAREQRLERRALRALRRKATSGCPARTPAAASSTGPNLLVPITAQPPAATSTPTGASAAGTRSGSSGGSAPRTPKSTSSGRRTVRKRVDRALVDGHASGPGLVALLIWILLALGAAASAAGLPGRRRRHRALPARANGHLGAEPVRQLTAGSPVSERSDRGLPSAEDGPAGPDAPAGVDRWLPAAPDAPAGVDRWLPAAPDAPAGVDRWLPAAPDAEAQPELTTGADATRKRTPGPFAPHEQAGQRSAASPSASPTKAVTIRRGASSRKRQSWLRKGVPKVSLPITVIGTARNLIRAVTRPFHGR